MKSTAYFSHDYNARNDRKLVKLKVKHKMAGVGVYWCLVEMLFEENGRLSLSDIDFIADEFRTDPEIVESVIKDFELFEFDEDCFWSNSVMSRLEIRAEKSKKASDSVTLRWENERKNREKYERNTNVERTKNDRNTNKVKESKVNKSKIEEREETAPPSTPTEKYFIPPDPDLPKKPKEGEKEKSSAKKEKEIIARAERVFSQSDLNYSDEFRQQWSTLCLMPKWRTKPEVSLQSSIRRLKEFSEDFSLLLIKSAIGGNWQGLVFADTQSKYQDYLRKNGQNGNASSSKSATSKEESRNRMVEKARDVLDSVASKYSS